MATHAKTLAEEKRMRNGGVPKKFGSCAGPNNTPRASFRYGFDVVEVWGMCWSLGLFCKSQGSNLFLDFHDLDWVEPRRIKCDYKSASYVVLIY